MNSRRDLFAGVFAIAAPLALAVIELFHPIPHDIFHVNLGRWLLVHYLQIILFPLSALAVVVLLRGLSGIAVAVCRTMMFLFGVIFVAFDTAAGVTTGVLLKASQASGTPELWRAPVLAIWNHPIIGGAGSPLLAIVGSIAWSFGAVSAAVAVRRAGSSWVPVILLVISAFGMSIFKTHAWPGGPLSFGSLAGAAAWLQLERRVAGVMGHRPN